MVWLEKLISTTRDNRKEFSLTKDGVQNIG